MRDFHDIVSELRQHPEALAVIVWTEFDIPDDIEPDSINWDYVEDRSIELGNEVIWDLGTLKPKEPTNEV